MPKPKRKPPAQRDLFGDDMKRAANDGMERALDHAERCAPGWPAHAARCTRAYARGHATFATEDLRVWAHGQGLAIPPDSRAWGLVIRRAVKAGWLVLDHYTVSHVPPAHARPVSVWRSRIMGDPRHA